MRFCVVHDLYSLPILASEHIRFDDMYAVHSRQTDDKNKAFWNARSFLPHEVREIGRRHKTSSSCFHGRATACTLPTPLGNTLSTFSAPPTPPCWFGIVCSVQIDLYSILARAPPAELGSTAHEPTGSWESSGRTVSKKADRSHRRERGLLKRLGSTSEGGERRAFNKVTTVRQEVDRYIARDPLGDEVAELNAKVQDNLRR